ncbi:hypothetical protein [Solirubrum puertoriconensis]|uniref:Uncharacterized protein n=1 Tax=Solirubrum puertoriconensis TaxID=1751427 RepID=A0A9X0HPC8_SOLP1|nr:hypothetical protein [Solirubrum puertoriconensis]KUG09640.1 hypothetical protein ASU33_18280 [Solirubrum puertoriconensis]
MTFTGDEGSFISEADGVALTKRYQECGINPNRALFLGKEHLLKLLEQDGAKGIRFYFGLKDDEKLTLVAVAASAEGEDLTSLVLNRGFECPDGCAHNSPFYTE